MHKLQKKLKSLREDRRGSESLEMLVTCAVIALVAYTVIMILIWAYNYYNTAAICRKLARQVEITGEYNELVLTNYAASLSGVDDPAAYNYIVVNGYYLNEDGDIAAELEDGAKLQLTTAFAIVVSTYDRLPVFFGLNSGESVGWNDVPISCMTTGISEVYFKTS